MVPSEGLQAAAGLVGPTDHPCNDLARVRCGSATADQRIGPLLCTTNIRVIEPTNGQRVRRIGL